MTNYRPANPAVWTGRISGEQLYLHEKIICADLTDVPLTVAHRAFALLGYTCDEGVRRNQGRVGAAAAPEAVRTMFGKLANHLAAETLLYDVGDVYCEGEDLEATHEVVSETIKTLLSRRFFPIVLGGGHDLAYAHYKGIEAYLKTKKKRKTLGVINLDAHFDLRTVVDNVRNSGTPFYQLAMDQTLDFPFRYCCLGIQQASNISTLYQTAEEHGVMYMESQDFTIGNKSAVWHLLESFINSVDYLYLTIDLDGFSSAIAPGVSAPSPFGFSVEIVLEVLQQLADSQKLISADLVELNPSYDIDHSTARLAARLADFLMNVL